MNIKGAALVYLIILILLGGGLLVIYNPLHSGFLQSLSDTYSDNFQPFNNQSNLWQPPKDWKSLDNAGTNLTLKYPSDWTISDDGIISQYPLPLTIDNSKSDQIYNFITIDKHVGAIFNGFYDTDLFEKIYQMKSEDSFKPDVFNQDNKKITKISSGKILSGERFVVFKLESDQILTKQKSEIKAYILKSNSIIILTLSHYNQAGLETFKKIVASVTLNSQ